jgi:hypothetical protein
VQVDRHVDPSDDRQGLQALGAEHSVHRTGHPYQRAQGRVGGQDQLVIGQRATQASQRRHTGQQVAEPERPQHQRERARHDAPPAPVTACTSPVVDRPRR